METAFSTMTVWMADWLKERKDEIASGAERQDVLSLMVKSAQEDGKWSMSDSELVRIRAQKGIFHACYGSYVLIVRGFLQIGNVFVLITAGHGELS